MPAHATSGLSRLPPALTTPDPRFASSSASGAIDDSDWERRARNRTPSARWIGWRLRALVLAALVGCIAMFLLLRMLAAVPALDARLRVDDAGVLRLAGCW